MNNKLRLVAAGAAAVMAAATLAGSGHASAAGCGDHRNGLVVQTPQSTPGIGQKGATVKEAAVIVGNGQGLFYVDVREVGLGGSTYSVWLYQESNNNKTLQTGKDKYVLKGNTAAHDAAEDNFMGEQDGCDGGNPDTLIF